MHCSINTMGIETIKFTLPLKNFKNETMMLSLEGGMTWSIPMLEKRSKWNSSSTACMLRVKFRRCQKPTTSWPPVFLPSFLGYQVKVMITLCPCFENESVHFEAGHLPLKNSCGLSKIEDSRNVCLSPKMCLLVAHCQVPQDTLC